jgi:hypothetical protein
VLSKSKEHNRTQNQKEGCSQGKCWCSAQLQKWARAAQVVSGELELGHSMAARGSEGKKTCLRLRKLEGETRWAC